MPPPRNWYLATKPPHDPRHHTARTTTVPRHNAPLTTTTKGSLGVTRREHRLGDLARACPLAAPRGRRGSGAHGGGRTREDDPGTELRRRPWRRGELQ
ncbi:unnamed protein product [Lampetra planeri]